jgi:hypothetical protein
MLFLYYGFFYFNFRENNSPQKIKQAIKFYQEKESSSESGIDIISCSVLRTYLNSLLFLNEFNEFFVISQKLEQSTKGYDFSLIVNKLTDDVACEKLKKIWENFPDLDDNLEDNNAIQSYFSNYHIKIITDLCNLGEISNFIPLKIIKDVEKMFDKFSRSFTVLFQNYSKINKYKNDIINFSKNIINGYKVLDNSRSDIKNKGIRSSQQKFIQLIYQFLEKNK